MEDLTSEIAYSKQRENMHRIQKEEITNYNETASKKIEQAILRNKELENRLYEEVMLESALREEYALINRTGRQPSFAS